VPRKGCEAAPGFWMHQQSPGLLRSPFAAQGRSYRECAWSERVVTPRYKLSGHNPDFAV